MKAVPVASLYVGKTDMLERVKEAIMVHQMNEQAIRFGMAVALLLESVILGSTLQEAMDKVIEYAKQKGYEDVADACAGAISAAKDLNMEDFIQRIGWRSCALPGSFMIPIFLLERAIADGEINEKSYIKALRANILAAGDTCGRGVFIGAVLAAAAGKVPDSWMDKLDKETAAKVDEAKKGHATRS